MMTTNPAGDERNGDERNEDAKMRGPDSADIDNGSGNPLVPPPLPDSEAGHEEQDLRNLASELSHSPASAQHLQNTARALTRIQGGLIPTRAIESEPNIEAVVADFRRDLLNCLWISAIDKILRPLPAPVASEFSMMTANAEERLLESALRLSNAAGQEVDPMHVRSWVCNVRRTGESVRGADVPRWPLDGESESVQALLRNVIAATDGHLGELEPFQRTALAKAVHAVGGAAYRHEALEFVTGGREPSPEQKVRDYLYTLFRSTGYDMLPPAIETALADCLERSEYARETSDQGGAAGRRPRELFLTTSHWYASAYGFEPPKATEQGVELLLQNIYASIRPHLGLLTYDQGIVLSGLFRLAGDGFQKEALGVMKSGNGYHERSTVNGIEISVGYDAGYRCYTIYFPQISIGEEASDQGVYDQVIMISGKEEEAKAVYDFAVERAESTPSLTTLYLAVAQYITEKISDD